ncbi:hypothetical protein chiPu_0019360, partial [Chiloscyllium punctatum]|nr:hypothetical protein [Chiloscyllium punctatum]
GDKAKVTWRPGGCQEGRGFAQRREIHSETDKATSALWRHNGGGSARSRRRNPHCACVALHFPVTDAVLIFFISGTEIQSTDHLILPCLVREGTEPQFLWYCDNVMLRNGSASYHVTADGGELVIHSFQRDHVGRNHCAAINKGAIDTSFNVTSDYIEFTLRENTTAGLVYSEVTIKKRKEPGKDLLASILRSCEIGW